MILITGASGKTGQAVIKALAQTQQPIRALIHKTSYQPLMHQLGVQEVLVGDMRSSEVLKKGMQSITAVYHICPNMHPDEIRIGETIIQAAKSANVSRFVYHSVLHPQIEAMPHHWHKMRVEEQLFTSDLPYTILQPAPYMQNLLAYWQAICTHQQYAIPYSPHAPLCAVDLQDVAEVAALTLTQAGHEKAIYELCGTELLSAHEVSQLLSQFLQKTIRVSTISRDTWAEQASANGLGSYQVETLLKMFVYYEKFGFTGNPNVLGWLLDHPPTTYQAFLQRVIKAGCTND